MFVHFFLLQDDQRSSLHRILRRTGSDFLNLFPLFRQLLIDLFDLLVDRCCARVQLLSKYKRERTIFLSIGKIKREIEIREERIETRETPPRRERKERKERVSNLSPCPSFPPAKALPPSFSLQTSVSLFIFIKNCTTQQHESFFCRCLYIFQDVQTVDVPRKKNKKGCLGTFTSWERLGERFFFFLHQKLIFFLPFFHGNLSLFRGPLHTWVSQESHARTRKRGEEKEERKKLILPHFIIRNNILQNHNVYRAIRIYDCGKYAYSNAILVRFDRIIVRVKVIGEREAEARDCCREKLPHLSFQLY